LHSPDVILTKGKARHDKWGGLGERR